jgi:X-Pro dipeptidyl-peptidase (S15 family)
MCLQCAALSRLLLLLSRLLPKTLVIEFALTTWKFTTGDSRRPFETLRGDSMHTFKSISTRVIFFACALFVFTCPVVVPAQEKEKFDVKANYEKREIRIPVRDGVKLFTSVYLPKDTSRKYPIMFSRTPYTVSPYGEDKFKGLLGPSEHFMREGYIFVYQDVRGRLMSEGQFEDVRPHIANKTGRARKVYVRRRIHGRAPPQAAEEQPHRY